MNIRIIFSCVCLLQVRVSLLDRNDNPPVFKPSSYTETIAEDSPIDYTVITVTAKDSDKQGVVKYSIEDGNDGSFKIDQKSGEGLFLYI